MAIVIDASVAIAWCVRDRPGTLVADATIEQGGVEGIAVPDLFWHEVRSTLLVGERKGRIEAGTMNDHMKDLRTLSIQTDAAQSDDTIAALSRKHGLSGYDAAYLETAIRRRAKLATLDKKLAGAAANESLSSDQRQPGAAKLRRL